MPPLVPPPLDALPAWPDWAWLVDRVGAYVYVKDVQGRYRFANAAVCALYGATAQQVIGAQDDAFIDLERSPRLLGNDNHVLQSGQAVHDEEELVLLSGARYQFWTTKVPLLDANGQVVAVCGFSTDISRGQARAEHWIGRNRLLGLLLANIDAHIYLKDHQGRYLYANEKVQQLYGRTLDEIRGRDDGQVLAPDVAAPLMAVDRQVLDAHTRYAAQEVVRDAQGREHHYWSVKLPLEQPGQPPCLIGFSTEITELLQLRQNLERQRVTDALTDLPNHGQFAQELAVELSVAAHEARMLAVVLLDVDHFKYINTHLGQEAGDQLLREAAQRLRGLLPTSSGLARAGGDAFAAILPLQADMAALERQVQRLRDGLAAAPFMLLGKPVQVTVSAGMALYPQDGDAAATLLANAEAAMYLAKERGRDQAQRYHAQLAAAAALRIDLESDLRAAQAAGQLELYYQPKLRAADGGLDGFEALLRWRRPGHGLVPPLHFIPLAEQLGLLVAMGTWAVEQACCRMAAWRAQGLGAVRVAVNLSPSQLQHPGLVEAVRASMTRHGIGPGQLEMEVTESVMMREPDQAITILQGLRALGVCLSIDDFGTGYSSMAYLKLLPVQTLKLDRFFVSDIDSDARNADLCAGIIALAHKLGLQVVAEGVETEVQRHALLERDCDLFQGYLFSRPMPEAEVADYCRRFGSTTKAERIS